MEDGLNGKEFLWKEEYWPQMILVLEMEDDDLEVRKETQVYTTATTDVLDRVINIILRSGNL